MLRNDFEDSIADACHGIVPRLACRFQLAPYVSEILATINSSASQAQLNESCEQPCVSQQVGATVSDAHAHPKQ